jgi:His/Glu/Gln/Arg/opine family amino acid ABC transporter permease subunit
LIAAEGLDFGPVWDQRGLLLGGIGTMVQVAVVSFALSIVGGLLLARLRRSAAVWVQVLGFLLVQILRGIALYVLVLWLFNGLAVASGIKLTSMQTGVVALSLLNSAYLSEVFRAGFGAVPVGQAEAALAVGLTEAQARRAVLTPQMIRVTFPAMGNVLVDIVKDTAILSVVGVSELTRETQRWAQFYFRPFEFYTVAGILYFLIVLLVSGGWGRLERRLRRHTDGHTVLATPRRWRSALSPSPRAPAPTLPS